MTNINASLPRTAKSAITSARKLIAELAEGCEDMRAETELVLKVNRKIDALHRIQRQHDVGSDADVAIECAVQSIYADRRNALEVGQAVRSARLQAACKQAREDYRESMRATDWMRR